MLKLNLFLHGNFYWKELDKMYIYNIGYHSYEESEYVQLYHKKEFDKKTFEKILCQATINVLKNNEEFRKEDKRHVTFQNIFSEVVEELIKNFEFKELKFTSEFSVFGWASILDEKDWKMNRDEQLNLLTKTIKRALK